MVDWEFIFLNICTLVLLPLAMAGALTWIGKYSKQILVNNLGNYSQNTIGGLGVFIHELSHMLMALIFGHKITKVKLLQISRHSNDDFLGYVNHSWNPKNVYECMGNFFVGIAPCFGSSLFLWFIHFLFWHANQFSLTTATNWNTLTDTVFQNIMHPLGSFGWQWIVFIILALMVSSTGYGLSKEDWKNTMAGLPYWFCLVLVFSTLIQLTHLELPTYHLMYEMTALWLTFLGWGVVYSLIALVFLMVIHYCKQL